MQNTTTTNGYSQSVEIQIFPKSKRLHVDISRFSLFICGHFVDSSAMIGLWWSLMAWMGVSSGGGIFVTDYTVIRSYESGCSNFVAVGYEFSCKFAIIFIFVIGFWCCESLNEGTSLGRILVVLGAHFACLRFETRLYFLVQTQAKI